MEKIRFIKKIDPFSTKLQKLYLQQEALKKQSLQIRFDQVTKGDEEMIHYDEVTFKDENPCYLSLSDKYKGQTQIPDVSYLFEDWKTRYYSKLTKMFRYQKYEQFLKLTAMKEAITKQFGELGEQFHWMVKQNSIGNNKSMLSYRLSQNKQYLLRNIQTNENAQFNLLQQDFKRLMPGKDLNDAVIDAYFKIMKVFILSQQVNQISYIFSTYLLQKLTFQIEQQAQAGQNDVFSRQWGPCARSEVKKKYETVQKWNRKTDIFSKKILVFPINMHSHWFCVIVLNPGSLIYEDRTISERCAIIFCDSLFQQRFFVVEAIREYLRLELQFKRNLKIEITEKNAPSFQLLLPRQINKHDCGLYMLAYIEELLLNHKEHFSNLQDFQRRNKLRYFPRKYMYSLRQRIMKLLTQLYQKQSCPQKTFSVLQKYIRQKQKIYEQAQKTNDYEVINERQLQKFFSFVQVGDQTLENEEQKYRYLIKFSLIKEINYIEKDALQESAQISVDEDSEYI